MLTTSKLHNNYAQNHVYMYARSADYLLILQNVVQLKVRNVVDNSSNEPIRTSLELHPIVF